VARILTAYYFLHFLVILPVLGYFETPKPLPKSISEPVLGKSGVAVGIGARAPGKN
jgi:ubiquinol-cytochrome c reductase cytochrome b subunit